MPVLIDDPKEQGIINDRRVYDVLCFLEKCAGAPEGALALLFPYYRRALRVLRGAGFARRAWKVGSREAFWNPHGFPPPTDTTYEARCALGWLAARLVEAGADLEGRDAVFPNGKRLPVYTVPPAPGGKQGLAVVLDGNTEQVPEGWYFVEMSRLREETLRSCLQKA